MSSAVNIHTEKQSALPLTREEINRRKKLDVKKQIHLFEAAICGHFSAGKSSLLNRITGAEVLPTSPIPTSANIITIKNGEPGLTVYSEGSEPQKSWTGEIPWPKVREWGMNGTRISGLTLTVPLPFLGRHSVILDTPGVDSTDDNHKKVTMEQLYTTDLIVYVMDYNHVQSETNLQFLKQCSLEKKPILLVVNQIDKHNENEVSISEFTSGLKEVLAKWDIAILDLFFTSMKQESHPLNEYSRFEKALKGMLYHSGDLLAPSLQRLDKGFYSALIYRLEEDRLADLADISEEMENRGFSFGMLEEKQELEVEARRLRSPEQEILDHFHNAFKRTFENVTLFPYTTTELASRYIESVKPGFKTGFFPNRRKKEAEQANRLSALAEELSDKGKTLVLYKVKDYLKNLDKSTLTNKEEAEKKLADLDLPDLETLLQDHVKTGHTDDQYVREFTSQVNKAIMKSVRKQAEDFLKLYAEGLKEVTARRQEEVQKKLQMLKDLTYYEEKRRSLENETDRYLHVINDRLDKMPKDRDLDRVYMDAMKKTFPAGAGGTWTVDLPQNSVIDTEEEEETEFVSDFDEKKADSRLTQIREVLELRKDSPVLKRERDQLLNRMKRYKNQTFMISLFGAFSAGKSSFANALLGHDVLPVSPNPTTATINFVRKSNNEFSHEDVLVTFKSEKALDAEIKAAAKELGEKIDYASLTSWKPAKKGSLTNRMRTYEAYLSILKQSLMSSDIKPGDQKKIRLDELGVYVAEEQTACLVEKAEIYFDCPITEKGIVLVDTPGVNSIHGRHTNVAFRQMRESDAIFYLTYYNHAFSKADEYFLQQMGKVNESFSRDKLYFVINASDLASGRGELNGVRKHVRNQLERNGIEKPRIHALSSREGLRWKQGEIQNEPSFSDFEQTFYSKTILELKELSYRLIEDELARFYKQAEESLQFMNAEKDEQEQKLLQVKELCRNFSDNIRTASFDTLYTDVEDQFDQLMIYLKERMRYVFNDYFSTSFNVTTLTGPSKRQMYAQFKEGLREWSSSGEQFLRQELESTSIRLEQRIRKRAEKWINEESDRIKLQLPHFYAVAEIETPSVETLIHADLQVEPEPYKDDLKSQKDFFENGRVKQVKERLTAEAASAAAGLIEENDLRFKEAVRNAVHEMESLVKDVLLTALTEEQERFETLFDPERKKVLEEEIRSLKTL
ncbi:hypothetical protein CR205_06550 [Alteribacter lacisalsi]|uniref:Dynamin N-terminal domain-containing protein n=1 Tax=Alteribacter lacisalsi TaxID=2045244 RepID=A0A2W0HBK5_9BACI|nr:dynamin family protein [Alteribacter lacisalsi]PYZ98251.1 hypothetical protein CR205_06550 [Alteribacter lacisalsi]